jgi:glucosamine kinase
MSFAAGVDGGGSTARAVIVDDAGRPLGRAEAPGAVVSEETARAAVTAVTDAVAAAAARAGVPLPVDALWAGLAGAGRETGRRRVEDLLVRAEVAIRVRVGTDAEAAFRAAFPTGPGILLIAGTGSIAWVRDPGGATWRVGGWGQLLGDEGSGYAIGLEALRAIARADDGRGPPTALRERVLEALGLERPEALVPWALGAAKADVARLAHVVSALAAGGDAVSERILDVAAAMLDAHVDAALSRSTAWVEPAEVVLWGGLLAEGGPLRDRVRERLASRPVVVRAGAIDAALGAARLALDLFGSGSR